VQKTTKTMTLFQLFNY